MRRVVVGMSGGVDSSVSAYLLKQRGLEVMGVSFNLWEAREKDRAGACCSLAAGNSAAGTAAILGISHSSIDVRQLFIERVVEPFVASYLTGLTPNPCILCNRHIKFPLLLREAERLGAGAIATGHYARVERTGKRKVLRQGVDPKKDQSYVLYALRSEELARLVLPLGELRKSEVRAVAADLSLPAADRPESQEICFIEDNDYARFIELLAPEAVQPGLIMTCDGRTVGRHRGLFRYTLGQRKGLGISSPEPLFVTGMDTAANLLYVGSREEALLREFRVADLNWLDEPTASFRAGVKVRSMMDPKPAFVQVEADTAFVRFDEAQWAPAPGQAAVFYDGDRVLGGGSIEPPAAGHMR